TPTTEEQTTSSTPDLGFLNEEPSLETPTTEEQTAPSTPDLGFLNEEPSLETPTTEEQTTPSTPDLGFLNEEPSLETPTSNQETPLDTMGGFDDWGISQEPKTSTTPEFTQKEESTETSSSQVPESISEIEQELNLFTEDADPFSTTSPKKEEEEENIFQLEEYLEDKETESQTSKEKVDKEEENKSKTETLDSEEDIWGTEDDREPKDSSEKKERKNPFDWFNL
nr:hypothetical protein [Prochloraceae cyanobacterium]